MDVRVRYLRQKRDGFYWQPTPIMRKAGFHPEPLGREPTAARRRADALNAEWDAFRRGESADPEAPKDGTMGWLIRHWQKSDEYADWGEATRKEFDAAAKVIGEEFGKFRVAAISRLHCRGFYKEERARTTLFMANRSMKWLRFLLFRAVDEELIKISPMVGFRLKQTDARQEVWDERQVACFSDAAVDAGFTSLAVAAWIAFDLAQRPGDIRVMGWSAYDGGKISVRQQKTGRLVWAPVLPDLKALLDAMPRKGVQIVICESTGRPYTRYHFGHLFRRIADKAGLQGKQFLDLRRSSAVRLAEAGCTTEEIVAITGHEIGHGQKILETYIPRNAKMAENAIAKLASHRTKLGTPDRKSWKSGAP